MPAKPLASRRTRQNDVTTARIQARPNYPMTPICFFGTLTSPSESGRLYVDHDVEIYGAWISAIAGTGTSSFEIYRNDELLQSFTVGAAQVYQKIDITSYEKERFLFDAPNDFIYIAATGTSGGHKNVVVQFLAYDNEGR